MSRKKHKFTFDPNKKGLRKILGDLETDIMEIVWAKGEITVRQVYAQLKAQREIAYTTVMTVMSRLAEKGLLKKIREGAAYMYRAASSREEFTQSTVKKIINELLADFAAPAISQFVESLGNEKPEKMEELAKLIAAKRKGKNV
ncbi:BlaI/MecI/CopY family transcriptional regulator [candidate division KSB1 bacterium]|nr:BlaI/MecI/CopY family transcriptional regulator [candidate division KSB1 bacterium]